MDDYARAALDFAYVDTWNCTEWRTDLLREEIDCVQSVCGIGQRGMESAPDTAGFERRAELGPIRAVPTYNFIEVAELGSWKISDAHEIDAGGGNRTSPRKLNQRQDRGRRPDFGIAGGKMPQCGQRQDAIADGAGTDEQFIQRLRAA